MEPFFVANMFIHSDILYVMVNSDCKSYICYIYRNLKLTNHVVLLKFELVLTKHW